MTRRAKHGRMPWKRRGDRGSAMVEFAIITPLLLALLFGIIDFANAYNDANSVRQGVREGARQGVVGNIPSTTGCGLHSPSTTNVTTQSLMCITKNRIGLTNSDGYVRVRLVDTGASPFTYGDSNYVADARHGMLVCAQYPMASITGLYSSMMSGRWIRSKVVMNIEKLYTSSPTVVEGEETGTGVDWSWCTA